MFRSHINSYCCPYFRAIVAAHSDSNSETNIYTYSYPIKSPDCEPDFSSNEESDIPADVCPIISTHFLSFTSSNRSTYRAAKWSANKATDRKSVV